jgi:hypothetical protein
MELSIINQIEYFNLIVLDITSSYIITLTFEHLNEGKTCYNIPLSGNSRN